MKVRFWGTRGSIARSSPDVLRYGGNTSCVEVRTAAGTLLVIDCGTGAHDLGLALMSAPPQPVNGSLLISHTHWDHIQGIPFFAPLYVPGNTWDIYAPNGLKQSLRETLAGQMQYTYFPITLEDLGATIRYHDLVEGVFEIDDVTVRTRYLNHPALTLGYRLEADGVSIVYSCDHESVCRQPIPSETELRGRERRHVEFLEGADLVIHDAQYTATEYANKIGWGHSTTDYAVAVCRAAGVKQLALTHHDPTRDDESIDEIVARTRAELKRLGHTLTLCAAAEGQTIDLGTVTDVQSASKRIDSSAVLEIDGAIEGYSVFMGAVRPEAASVIRAATGAENLPLVSAPSVEEAIRSVDAERPSVVILDADVAPKETDAICRALRTKGAGEEPQMPIVVIANQDDEALDVSDMVADWLIWPFSEQFARTKIRAWVLRTKCQWLRARIPDNEVQRLAELHALDVLDTEPEERFDRITRIASEALEAPIALFNLVDRDRQWSKSCFGVDVQESSREVAFCAHAILKDEVMVVPDTLLDRRFADNPHVAGEPRVRFYAGCPIKSPGRLPIGTLCVVDMRPRQLDGREINLLKDLAMLVEKELLSPAGRDAVDSLG